MERWHAGGQHVRGCFIYCPICVDRPHNPMFGSQRRLENNGKIEIGFLLVQDRRHGRNFSLGEELFSGVQSQSHS